MTGSEDVDIRFEIERLPFDAEGIDRGSREIIRFRDWPVVYTLNDEQRVYVGESMSAVKRMRQHLENDDLRLSSE